MSRLINTADEGCYPLPYSPKACAVTGRAEGEIVDFNVVIDRPEPTRLYICRETIEEVAREEFGMVSAGKAKKLEEWLEHARKERDELRDVIDTAAKLEERRPDAVNRKELASAR